MQPFPTLQRYEHNPIITHKDVLGATQVYNAGAVKFGDEYILLMSVLTDAPLPKMHLARSADGIEFKVDEEPFITAEPEEGWLCDPRITFIDGIYYILYWSGSNYGARSVLCKTSDFRTVERMGYICEPDNRNMALFPERINGLYARLDRPYGASHAGSIWISYSPDLIFWGKSEPVADIGDMFQWEGEKVGPGATPILTDKGWLIIYHGKRGGYFGYHLGCMLLDIHNPAKVLGRIKSSVLSPCEPYERMGAIPNVVFTCGAIEEAGGKLKIYYSGADTCICLATADKNKLAEKCLVDGPGSKP